LAEPLEVASCFNQAQPQLKGIKTTAQQMKTTPRIKQKPSTLTLPPNAGAFLPQLGQLVADGSTL
jgi:hypothetical protein